MCSCITRHSLPVAAEGSTPVEIDHERVMRLGARMHAADLLPDQLAGEARRHPNRLATTLLQTASHHGSPSADA